MMANTYEALIVAWNRRELTQLKKQLAKPRTWAAETWMWERSV
jgi:hypothetical protein